VPKAGELDMCITCVRRCPKVFVSRTTDTRIVWAIVRVQNYNYRRSLGVLVRDTLDVSIEKWDALQG
jgi:hypothetical protein